MTSVGHALTGAAIGVVCMRPGLPVKYQGVHLLAFMVLANIPDAPLPGWGHDLYYFSHSIFVNLLLIGTGVAFLAFSPRLRAGLGGWWVIAPGALAWLSHLLLDSFYNHGKGIAIFWPVSLEMRLVLPIPWFSVLYGGLFPMTVEKVQILLIEVASYFPLVLLAVGIRSIVQRRG